MAKLLVLILFLATLSSSFSLKKDKFKIKAKGFGLKNLQAAAAEAPPAPAPAPYYPPASYGPPAASYGLGGGMIAAKSAGLASVTAAATSAAALAPQVVPVIIPITLMAQSAFEPITSAVSGLGSQIAMHIPRVDFESAPAPASAPGPDMGAAYGYSALHSNTMDYGIDGMSTGGSYGR